MASIHKIQNGYRVSWYDTEYNHHQQYFYGLKAHDDAQLLCDQKSQEFPSRQFETIIRSSNRNTSGMVGVFRSKTYSKFQTYFAWSVSIRIGPDGQKCRKTIRFYDHKEGSSEVAFQKACDCRKLYNQCIEVENITAFYEKY